MKSSLVKLTSLVFLFAVAERAFAGSDYGPKNMSGPQKIAQMYADHFNNGKGATNIAHFGPGPDPRKPFTVENARAGLIPPDLWAMGPLTGPMVCNGKSASAGLYCVDGKALVLGAHHVGSGECGKQNPASIYLDSENTPRGVRPQAVQMVNAAPVGSKAYTCLKILDVAAFKITSPDYENLDCGRLIQLAENGVSSVLPNTGAMIATHSNIFSGKGRNVKMTKDYREHFQIDFNVYDSKNFPVGIVEYPGAATGTMSSGTPVFARSNINGQYLATAINTHSFEKNKVNVPKTELQSLKKTRSGNIGSSSAAVLSCLRGSTDIDFLNGDL